jgi:hypothetical protein
VARHEGRGRPGTRGGEPHNAEHENELDSHD